MKRPRRAAAIRAVSHLAALKTSNDISAEPSTSSPSRKLRSASYHINSDIGRDRKRRRSDFERIVKSNFLQNHHLSTTQSTNLSSAGSDKNRDCEQVQFTAEWAKSIVDEPVESMKAALRALLRGLQSTPNLIEAVEESQGAETPDISATPPEDADVRGLAEVLAKDAFVSHEEKTIKLLVACSLAELLRICAPDPPIGDKKLDGICDMFIEQLTMLSSPNDTDEALRFSLLEQLARVKAFVIFCDNERVVCDIFACLYAIAQGHQSEKVKQYFTDILVSLLDETENLDTMILDAMLAPLVPALKYSKHAAQLAERVLRSSSSFIQVPLSSLLNASLRSIKKSEGKITPRKTGNVKGKVKVKDETGNAPGLSEHHDHISDLIVVINRVVPDVLVYVLPNLEDGLVTKDEKVRLGTSHLLGRLFSSRADVGHSYSSLFAEFLKRGSDASADVRTEVTRSLGHIMIFHPKHAEHVDELLRSRVFDRDERVRIAAVGAVGVAGDSASEELLKLTASRLRDKKANVRSQAVTAITQIYASTSSLGGTSGQHRIDQQQLDDLQDEMEIDKNGSSADQEQSSFALETRTQRLSWLPDILAEAILSVDGFGDTSAVMQIENIIFHDLVGLETTTVSSIKPGMRRLFVFLSHLSDSALVVLSNRIRARSKMRSILLAISTFSSRSRRSSTSESEPVAGAEEQNMGEAKRGGQTTANSDKEQERNERLVANVKYLTTSFRGLGSKPSEIEEHLHALAKSSDVTMRDKIKEALRCNSSFAEYKKSCDTITKSSTLNQAVRNLLVNIAIPRAYVGVFSAPYVSLAAQIAISECQSLQNTTHSEISSSLLRGVTRYLDTCAECVPESLTYAINEIHGLCSVETTDDDSTGEVILCGLNMMSRIPGKVPEEVDRDAIISTLRVFLLAKKFANVKYGALLAKRATHAFLRLQQHQVEESDALPSIASTLTSAFDQFDGRPETLLASMSALSQIAKYSSKTFRTIAMESFDFARGLLSGSLNGKIKQALCLSGSEPQLRRKQEGRSITAIFGPHSGELMEQFTDERFLCIALLAHRAVKVLVYSLRFVDEEEITSVIRLLLDIAFDKDGDVFDLSSDVEDGAEDGSVQLSFKAMRAVCRMFAGRGILFLARHPKYLPSVTVEVIASTVLLAQDPNACVRLSFARSVCQSILRKGLPLRWIVALPLMAIDPNRENLAKVKSMLASVFWHRRRLFDHAKRKVQTSSIKLLPEATIPELIWVLANYPDVELDQEQGFGECEKCIRFFMDTLLESNEHAGIMHQYIESLSIAQDATEPDNQTPGEQTNRIHELSQMAAAILKKKQAGKKWNLSNHPGRITLPRDMFRIVTRKTDTSAPAKPASSMSSEAR